ncbi:MAG TPA: NHLP bacteriocin system secretion protein [Thermoanaerobaculia bacterium]|nr:NHLP bacteriocin system secretion protein [Thermoanaerobaculia bacterium]
MIFRKVALERLSSPEQLDQLLQVTDPKGWLALGALGTILVSAFAWGVWGAIPTESTGEGILLRSGGLSDLVAPSAGQIEEVLVSAGDVIEKGQPVAGIRQEELQRQIADRQAKMADLRNEFQQRQRYSQEQERLRARDLAQQRANLELGIKTLDAEVDLLSRRLEDQEALLADGLVTKQTVVATQQELNAKRDQREAKRLELNGLESKRLESSQQLAQELETRERALRDLELERRELEAKLKENRQILSPHAGRVVEMLVNRGDVVSPGTPVLSLEVITEDLVAVLFVPASAGKRVRAGMPVRVSPSTVKREEYGSMLGTVTSAAAFPATQRGMTKLLGNDALVTKLMEAGPLIQVDVALQQDPSTPTGYRWSSSRGPTLEISSGTLATGDIIVKEDRPISLVIPTLREKLGV